MVASVFGVNEGGNDSTQFVFSSQVWVVALKTLAHTAQPN